MEKDSLEGAVVVRFLDRTYSARRAPSGNVIVTANGNVDIFEDELGAYLWLGNHGLRRARIHKLLDAACRNQGPFADPNHPKRVKP